MTAWERGVETAEVVSPFPQKLVVTALGGSVGTPPEGIAAPVVEMKTLEALEEAVKADPDAVRGKIVFFSRRTVKGRNGAGLRRERPDALRPAPRRRGRTVRSPSSSGRSGPRRAASPTPARRITPTGGRAFRPPPSRTPTPTSSSGSWPAGPVKVKVVLGCRPLPPATSANVIGEVPGREKPDEVVVVSGHLDSWDLGTGAIDDGAGCAIAIEAARLIAESPRRPRRTIRVVLYANEESGLAGGKGYAARHAAELPKHAGAFEADSGTGAPLGFSWNAADTLEPALAAVAKLLEPLGAGTLRKGGARRRRHLADGAGRGAALRPEAGDRDATSTSTTRPTTRSTRSKPPRSTRRPPRSPRWPTRWRTFPRSTPCRLRRRGGSAAVTPRRRARKARATGGVEPEPVPLPGRRPGAVPRPARCGASPGGRRGRPRGVLSQELFAGMPRVGDEVSYAFQGRIFSAGQLFLCPAGRAGGLRVQQRHPDVGSMVREVPARLPAPPGRRVAPGNAVARESRPLRLRRLRTLPSRLEALRAVDRALVGAGLFATLPFAFLQAASFMSHVASFAVAVWCLSLVADGDSARSRTRLLAAGLLGGMAFLVRPVSAVFLLFGPRSPSSGPGSPAGTTVPGVRLPRGRKPPAARFPSLDPMAVLRQSVRLRIRGLRSAGRASSATATASRPLADIFRGESSPGTREHLPNALWATPGSPFFWLLLVLVRPRKEDLVVAAGRGRPLARAISATTTTTSSTAGRGSRSSRRASSPSSRPEGSRKRGGDPRVARADRAGFARPRRLPPTAAVLAGLLALATVAREVPRIRAHARNYMGVPNDPMAGADRAGVGPDALVLVDFEDPRRSMEYTAADSPAYYGYLLPQRPRALVGPAGVCPRHPWKGARARRVLPAGRDLACRREPVLSHRRRDPDQRSERPPRHPLGAPRQRRIGGGFPSGQGSGDPVNLPSLPSAGGAAPLVPRPVDGPEVELSVKGMHCASCVGRIESALGKVPGVSLAVVDLLSGRARVRLSDPSLAVERLVDAVAGAGYEAQPARSADLFGLEELVDAEQAERATALADLTRRLAVAATVAVPVAILSMAEVTFPGRDALFLVLTAVVLGFSGRDILVSGARAAGRLAPDMNTPRRPRDVVGVPHVGGGDALPAPLPRPGRARAGLLTRPRSSSSRSSSSGDSSRSGRRERRGRRSGRSPGSVRERRASCGRTPIPSAETDFRLRPPRPTATSDRTDPTDVRVCPPSAVGTDLRVCPPRACRSHRGVGLVSFGGGEGPPPTHLVDNLQQVGGRVLGLVKAYVHLSPGDI